MSKPKRLTINLAIRGDLNLGVIFTLIKQHSDVISIDHKLDGSYNEETAKQCFVCERMSDNTTYIDGFDFDVCEKCISRWTGKIAPILLGRKICDQCQKEKPLDDFRKTNVGGYAPSCKACQDAKREVRKKTKRVQREKLRERYEQLGIDTSKYKP